jgi:hypothetical protein
MAASKRTIFRNKAMQHYTQSREKDILPRFVAPPVFIFLWILLGLLFIATVLAWLEQVPTYVTGSGVVLDQGVGTQNGGNEAVAVVFLPATTSLKVTAGQPIQVQVGSSGPQLSGTIATVKPGVLSPSQARQQYGLNGSLAQVITQPSVAVTVQLGPGFSTQTYAGSIVNAQVQVGTRRVLSLLPWIGQLIGE